MKPPLPHNKMKAKLENPVKHGEEKRRTQNVGVGPGRPELPLKFPQRFKRGFTIAEAIEKNPDVSEITVRNRLNRMTQEGKAKARSVPNPNGGRGHPIHVFTLVA